MIKIGNTRLGKGPAIAVTVTDSESFRVLRGAKRRGASLFEIRIDRFRRLDENWLQQKIRTVRRAGLPLIATIRSRQEGGRRQISDPQRFQIFKRVLPWIDAVDLELSSSRLKKVLIPLARRRRKRVILSYHNFKSTPSNRVLTGLIRRGKRQGADIVKIAVTPRNPADVARLLLLTRRHRDQNLITIAMGRRGRVSRILGPVFGSLLTYSFLGRQQAPGQVSLPALNREMKPFWN